MLFIDELKNDEWLLLRRSRALSVSVPNVLREVNIAGDVQS